MNVKVYPGISGGKIRAIDSKSCAHRIIICAAFADRETYIHLKEASNDILATARCAEALGASVARDSGGFSVSPAKRAPEKAALYCGESGSTYRFMMPVACALGTQTDFILEGRLPLRPMGHLFDVLTSSGVRISGSGTAKVSAEGKLTGNEFFVDGSASSQFITGLMLALPLMHEKGSINITGALQSKGYIDITADVMRTFNCDVDIKENNIYVTSERGYVSPIEAYTEGDWSNAAFALCAAAAAGVSVSCTNLKTCSTQGDSAVCSILERFGADVKYGENEVTVTGMPLTGIEIDAGDIPDLVPAIAVTACAAKGKTVIKNAGRLKMKESDRLITVSNALRAIGADISVTDDSMTINGKKQLNGGTADAAGDHRIAMMAAMAAALCKHPVVVRGAEAVAKSYPEFFSDIKKIGIRSEKEE